MSDIDPAEGGGKQVENKAFTSKHLTQAARRAKLQVYKSKTESERERACASSELDSSTSSAVR